MNKLLPTALLLAVAGVAQAQVTVYGAYLDLGRTVNKTAPAPDVKANAYALGVIYVF